MAFAAATTEKVIAYLGYPYTAASIREVETALAAVSATTQAAAAETRIEAWLAELDTIAAAIDTQRDTEGSTLLGNLRREGRRYVELVRNALSLEERMDFFGTSGV